MKGSMLLTVLSPVPGGFCTHAATVFLSCELCSVEVDGHEPVAPHGVPVSDRQAPGAQRFHCELVRPIHCPPEHLVMWGIQTSAGETV